MKKSQPHLTGDLQQLLLTLGGADALQVLKQARSAAHMLPQISKVHAGVVYQMNRKLRKKTHDKAQSHLSGDLQQLLLSLG